MCLCAVKNLLIGCFPVWNIFLFQIKRSVKKIITFIMFLRDKN